MTRGRRHRRHPPRCSVDLGQAHNVSPRSRARPARRRPSSSKVRAFLFCGQWTERPEPLFAANQRVPREFVNLPTKMACRIPDGGAASTLCRRRRVRGVIAVIGMASSTTDRQSTSTAPLPAEASNERRGPTAQFLENTNLRFYLVGICIEHVLMSNAFDDRSLGSFLAVAGAQGMALTAPDPVINR